MSEIPEVFLSPYKPIEHEDDIYALWEKSDLFNPDTTISEGYCSADSETFSIVLPPPNRTGTLHIGHAVMLAIQDVLVRYHRMQGKRTLWIPGTDHAAIATESKVEAMLLKKEKKTRHDLGRDAFLKRVHAFADESHATITKQVKKMGASLDWSREAYTLDEDRARAVRTAFTKMYEGGLIYRGHRIVNWDPKLKTNVSDDEIEWITEKNPFYYLKYGPFTIGTSRPETKFGDKYVVMHPNDERYSDYKHGQQIELEWINGSITATVIKDEATDMEFGTGVMTITPWHDHTDFEIAERHDLDKEQIIDFDGRLLPIAGDFAGQHISKARARIVERLKEKGLLERVDDHYEHRIATNSRGGGIIEPQIRQQWFIDVNTPFTVNNSKIEGISEGSETTLKELMRHVVASKQIEIIPERFDKTYFHWIDNLRDWCISRQIWFGHQIPVWYREDEVYVGTEEPDGDGWEQDTDTLDTWFSSGLWTFATLGWPNETDDLAIYHPTTLLETGYDIIFFWVARMILMSGYLRSEVPFRTVYLHGLVRDEKGRKMSKSLGNIIDPLDVAERYGADAVRLSLLIGTGPGADSKMSEDKVRAYKKFANKLWNISRFVLTNAPDIKNIDTSILVEHDQTKWDEFVQLARDIETDIESYRLYLAAEKLYHYAWHTFADEIIESCKERLNRPDGDAESARMLLVAIHKDLLKLLHPFIPFVTEAIWQKLAYRDSTYLLVAPWPSRI